MNRASLRSRTVGGALAALWLTAMAVVAAGGCATGTEGFGESTGTNGGDGGSDEPTTTSTSSAGLGGAGGAGGDPTTTTSSGMGGSGAGNPCGPQEHQCGGICVGNTPQTGCAGSTTCSPCVAPSNGVAVCTPDGLCDFQCNTPYQKNGGACQCTNQCCSNNDCQGGLSCSNGVCVCQAQCCSDAQCSNPTTSCSGGTCACNDAKCFTYCLSQNTAGICFPLVGCVCG
ncbi:uncharacterized protein CMC5_068180 [Chondromyces crocatus]|uniref:PE-PGRS family protein n=1 Tax=Chondromyces crocatus TaxID=52 RepID=A0A0K1EP20_CHOCO|nr:uncharacterized protein CMC5_068180 [Chondromyces crocatus]